MQALQVLSLVPWLLFMFFGLIADRPDDDLIAMLVALALYPLFLLAGDGASWVLLHARERALALVITGVVTLPTVLILVYDLANRLLHPLP